MQHEVAARAVSSVECRDSSARGAQARAWWSVLLLVQNEAHFSDPFTPRAAVTVSPVPPAGRSGRRIGVGAPGAALWLTGRSEVADRGGGL